MSYFRKRKRTNSGRRQRRGNAAFISLIFLVVLVAIGAIVGAVALRDQIVQELGDVSVGLDTLDQSYSYSIAVDSDADGTVDYTLAAAYADPAPTLFDPPGAPPADIQFTVLPPDSLEAPVAAPAGTLP